MVDLNLFDLSSVEAELLDLSSIKRIAFAASICERSLPNYNAFSRLENFGDPSILREALDEIWDILDGKSVQIEKINQFQKKLDSDDIIPDCNDFGGGSYIAEAQYAITALYFTLKSCINSSQQIEHIVSVVDSVKESLYSYIREIDPSVDNFWGQDEKYQEAITSHSLAVQEINKQQEDIQRLKDVETLDNEFLNSLRTSSNKNNVSFLNLS